MKLLSTLQNIKLDNLTLLDMSYIVVLLPIMLMLKIPMLIFVFIVLAIVLIKKTPANNLLVSSVFLLGVLALFLSLYGVFSFKGLSRLKLFLELLTYILIIVVSMQRLTRTVNLYLLISPMLLLALSLFFYHGSVMLIYVIFELFFLLWMILAYHQKGDLVDSFRSGMVMFMYSLPWVVVLFIFFPRISFEHATYGFKGENIQRMGHDGTMFLDNKALLVPSDRIVMEIGFNKEIPPSAQLYLRGSILYIDKKDHWEGIGKYIKRDMNPYRVNQEDTIKYQVTLYPTQKNWIYLFDMPSQRVKESVIDRDLISTLEKPIKEPMHYSASSFLSSSFYDRIDKYTLKISSRFDHYSNPKTYQKAQEIKKEFTIPIQRANALMKFFKNQSLTYSLKAGSLDMNNTTDSFLFDKKRGYCVHFASSFATMARMSGIPARVVTGYRADRANSIKNYIAVKERDAHAWTELYIDTQWIRYEATATASKIEQESQTQNNEEKKEKNEMIEAINLYLMYVKYQVDTWILYYSNVRQLQLIEYVKKNPNIIYYFIASLAILILITYFIISYFRRPRCSHETLCILEPLLNRLKDIGYVRDKEETLHRYFIRYIKDNPNKNIQEVDKIYEEISYGNQKSKNHIKELKIAVKRALKS